MAETMTADAEAFAAVRKFLASSTALDPNAVLTDATPLLEGDLIDSLGILQLATFLEQEFGFQVADEDFAPENFETLGSLVRYINTRRAQ